MATEPTGTPEQTPVSAEVANGSVETPAGGSATEETPEQLRARLAELERIHQQDLSRLSAGEDAARRLREYEEQQRTGYGPQPATGQQPNYADQLRQDYWTTQDPNANLEDRIAAQGRLTAASLGSAYQTQQQYAWDRELSSVGDEKRRQQIDQNARKWGVSPEWAKARMERDEFQQQQATLAAREKAIAEQEARLKRGVVDTTASPAPPTPGNPNEMTAEAYAREQFRLQEAGKMAEAAELKRRKQSGELKVSGG